VAAGWTLLWFCVALALNASFGERHSGIIILAWIWTSLLWVVRREAGRSPIVSFLLNCLPAALLTNVARDMGPWAFNPRGVRDLPNLILVYLFALTVARCATTVKRLSAVLAAWGGVAFGAGSVIAYFAHVGAADGREWSDWSDIRWWQPYANYPFANSEAIGIGYSLIFIGVSLCAVAWLRSTRASARGSSA